MHEVEIKVENDDHVSSQRAFMFPSNWDELTAENLISIARVDGLPEDEGHIILFRELSKLNWIWIARYVSPDDFKFQLIEGLLKPLLSNPVMTKGIMKNAVKGFTGLDDGFVNLCWGRWCMIDAFYNAYQRGNKDALDTFCALVYQPNINWFFKLTHKGDGWEKHENADRFIPMWKKKPVEIKVATAIHYGALRKHVVSMFPNLFPQPVELNQVEQENVVPKQDAPVDYHGLTISLSGGPFGNRMNTENEPVHNILKYLDMQAKNASKKSN